MIDIHAHILPGLDDGARDIRETIEMLSMAAKSGITDIIATPHCNLQGVYDNYYNHRYKEIFREVEEAIAEHEIPIRIYTGGEIFATVDLPYLMKSINMLTLNGSRYMLVEFDFDDDVDFANEILEQISDLGVCPVIAHPERYFFIQQDRSIAVEWTEKGYVLQCNKGSFSGRFGNRCAVTAYELLERGLVSVIASDAHSSKQRTPIMMDTYEDLLGGFDADYLDVLFEENPRRILNDEPVLRDF